MLAVLAVALSLTLLPPAGQQASVGGESESFARWVEDLGHDDPDARAVAAARLRASGRAAWPALRAASAHPDPEIRGRAQDVLAASQLRRRLPWRVMDECPAAVDTLRAGAPGEKIALLRVLARSYEDTSDLMTDLLKDPDPEVAIAAAEALQEHRNPAGADRLLELFGREDCPRAGRVYELLTLASARLPAADLQRLFDEAGPRARNRLLQLSMNANLPLRVPQDALRGMLRGGDVASRRSAMAWLRERGGAGLGVEVEPLLCAAEPQIVGEALSTLRALHHRPDPLGIAALLRHDDPGVREEAIQAAVAFEDAGCLPNLRGLLEDPSTTVRQSAVAALPRLGGVDALTDVLRSFFRDSGEPREMAATILARSPEWSEPRVRPLLQDADPDRRQRAYDLLARIGTTAVLAPLARDREETVRRWALQKFLSRPEVPGTMETLETFTRDDSDSLRFEALRALVRLGKREHVPALQGFLDSKEYTLRYDAAETLLEQRDDKAERLARRLLEDADAPVRRLGLSALADRGDRAEIDRSMTALQDPDGRLRRTAAQYLGRVLTDKRDPALVGALAKGLETWEEETLQLAFTLVMEHGDAAEAPRIRAMLLSGRAPRPDRAVRALAEWTGDRAPQELASLLGNDASLNETVFHRLKEVRQRFPQPGRKELEESFSKLLSNPDRRIRRGAAQAAGDLALPVRELPGLIDDAEPSVRCVALGTCRALSIKAAAPAAESHLDDEDPDVRVAAVATLAALKPEARGTIEKSVASEECAWARRRMEMSLVPPAK